MEKIKMQWLAMLILVLLVTGVGTILQAQTTAMRDMRDEIALLSAAVVEMEASCNIVR